MDALKKRGDKAGLERTEQAYQKFLKSPSVASNSGQSFQSLQWAGENLLKLKAAEDANKVFAKILDFYSKDEAFQKQPNAADKLLRVRIKQAAALREIGNLSESESILVELVKENKRLIDPQVEMGYLLDAKAEAKSGTWALANSYWTELARKLAQIKPRPTDYYEAWYHAALALKKQGKNDLARQTLASVTRLSPPDLGGPEMKAKYQDLAKQVAK